MITEYAVVLEYTAESLAEQVDKYIRHGWQPRGDLQIGFSDGGVCYTFVQVMIKEKQK